MMAGFKQNLLSAVFLLIVIVPAVILSFFAIRAVNQEEMVQKRRLEDALLLELEQTNTILNLNLEQIIQELHDTIPDGADADAVSGFIKWETANPLAGTSYILNKDGSIHYPDISDKKMQKEVSDKVNLFYWRYLNLFSNKESIPIYRNIASEYEKEILDEKTRDTPAEGGESSEIPENAASDFIRDSIADTGKKDSVKAETAEQAAGKAADLYGSDDKTGSPSTFASPSTSAPLLPGPSSPRSKSALGIFESDTAVQERVYKKAEEEGQQYLTRNVLPQIALTPRKENTQTVVRSVYIESTKYFEDIIRDNEYGVIPRLFDSEFILLYWEKQGDIVAGCEIHMPALNEKLAGAIQTPVNSFRFINILDQGGSPVIPVSGNNANESISAEKWRQPFVAKEISGILPYWETAILLRSPEEFRKQIENSRYFLSSVIALLCILIFSGITAIYYFSSARLREVQQKAGFVTNVSHELKTPLTSIRMYSEMLSEGYQKDPEKIQKYSSYIASESQRLTRLINNVLDFAKLEKGSKVFNFELIDINSLISDLLPSHKEELEKSGFILAFHPAALPLYAYCDREAVTQVLINLISNAVKYSGENKDIEIRTEKDDNRVSVKIIDRGIGIHKKYRKKIFREFFRIDTTLTSDSKGTGLGLSIARKIMRQHGGDLVFSPVNADDYRAGSIFTLLFPEAEIKEAGSTGDKT